MALAALATAVVYGYQRFDNHIMIATIVVLIALIQTIQFFGDRLVAALRHPQDIVMTTQEFELRKTRSWPWLLLIIVVILLAAAGWFWRSQQPQAVVLVPR